VYAMKSDHDAFHHADASRHPFCIDYEAPLRQAHCVLQG
jgi:hypothetical protein